MLSVEIINDRTGTSEIGNYRYDVYINLIKIINGTVTGHERSKGIPDLLRMVADNMEKNNGK